MSGKVQVESYINKKTGEFRLEVVGHADGASCADGVDDDLLDELVNLEIPGFGKADVEAEGPTMEWQREKARLAVEDKTKDMNGETSDNEDDGRATRYQEENEERSLDKGFGV